MLTWKCDATASYHIDKNECQSMRDFKYGNSKANWKSDISASYHFDEVNHQ